MVGNLFFSHSPPLHQNNLAHSPVLTIVRSSSSASRCSFCSRRQLKMTRRYVHVPAYDAPRLYVNMYILTHAPRQIWHIPQTGEIFLTYEDYLNRYVPLTLVCMSA